MSGVSEFALRVTDPPEGGEPMTAKQLVAEEIRALKARRNDTQEALAAHLGRSQSYVSRRLTGEYPFDLDDLELIAARYDVPITDLFPRTNHQESSRTNRQNSREIPVLVGAGS